MEELTLEWKLQNVTEEQEQEMKKLQADIESDADFIAANSLEEEYLAVKKYVKLTMEQFKAAYEHVKEKIEGLFEEVQAKRELSDEELDIVSGGGFFSWVKKKAAAIGAVFAGAALMIGGIVSAPVTGGAGALMAMAGFMIFGVGLGVCTDYKPDGRRNK